MSSAIWLILFSESPSLTPLIFRFSLMPMAKSLAGIINKCGAIGHPHHSTLKMKSIWDVTIIYYWRWFFLHWVLINEQHFSSYPWLLRLCENFGWIILTEIPQFTLLVYIGSIRVLFNMWQEKKICYIYSKNKGIYRIVVNPIQNDATTWIVWSSSFIYHEWCTYWTIIWYATSKSQITKKWHHQKDTKLTLFLDDKWLIQSLMNVNKHSNMVELYIINLTKVIYINGLISIRLMNYFATLI